MLVRFCEFMLLQAHRYNVVLSGTDVDVEVQRSSEGWTYLEGYLFLFEIDAEYAREESYLLTITRARGSVQRPGRHAMHQSMADMEVIKGVYVQSGSKWIVGSMHVLKICESYY